MSETKRANRNYEIDRYFLMDSQKLLSWRNPNYMAKFNHYILEEEINPITLEPATAEEIQTAEWYNRIHPITETLSWGAALYSAYVGYNQYYNKPYTTIPEAFSKGKDWIKGKIPSMGSQPVVPEAEIPNNNSLLSVGQTSNSNNMNFNFNSEQKLMEHFQKHGDEFNNLYSNPKEYLEGANDVIRNGIEIEIQYRGESTRAFVRFMGNDSRGNAKFEFVGISSEGNIATYHTKSGKDFWKKVNNGEFIKNINPVMGGEQ